MLYRRKTCCLIFDLYFLLYLFPLLISSVTLGGITHGLFSASVGDFSFFSYEGGRKRTEHKRNICWPTIEWGKLFARNNESCSTRWMIQCIFSLAHDRLWNGKPTFSAMMEFGRICEEENRQKFVLVKRSRNWKLKLEENDCPTAYKELISENITP